jgi:hypothetical protein
MQSSRLPEGRARRQLRIARRLYDAALRGFESRNERSAARLDRASRVLALAEQRVLHATFGGRWQ